MIGKILGNRYKLISELGNGGMAWVYLAHDLSEDRSVAVKVLYPQLSQDVAFLQRFSQEARLVMSLSQSSPEMHVVSVLDYGSDREAHYLVMEYVAGQDLRHALDEWRTLTWQEALDVGRQVALALGHAHRHGIVHRDVKPENIMLVPDGTVRVLDFGVARARNSPTLTHSGFVGSPYYAAPEQAMGRPVDIRADLYSLGIVLYEMVTGNRPFLSDTPWAIISHHVASPPPLLEDSHPELPRAVARLIRKAMAKQPEDRFQTPAEMLEAIEVVLAGKELPTESRAMAPEALAPLLAGLYQRAHQAGAEENWPEAVDLLSQVLKLDPCYRDVSDQLAEAGRQARLAALYAGAKSSLEAGVWDDAVAQLEEIGRVAPAYRDAGRLLATARHRQKVDRLYRQGVQHLEAEEWAAAAACLRQVRALEPGYQESDDLLAGARAGAALATGRDRVRDRQQGGRRRNLLWGVVAVLILALAVECYLFYRSQQAPVVAANAPPSLGTGPSLGSGPSLDSEPSPDRLSTLVATAGVEASPLPAGRDTATAEPSATSLPPTRPPLATSTRTPLPSATASATPTLALTPTANATATPALAGQIAFPRFDPLRGTYDVFACRVDGAQCRRLAAAASQPDLAPDGTRLVVHSWQPDRKGLVLQSLAGQWLWQITASIEAARPSVDAQANSYVFHSRDESDRQPRLYRTYGTEVRPIVRDGGAIRGQSPAWLPDGRIVFSGCLGDACGILLMRADGTQARQLVAGSSDTNPEASPDGRQVAFMSLRDGNWEIYVVGTDGSGLQRLTHQPGNDGLPAWSPDGRQLAFVSDRSGRWAVWVMAPDGSGQRRLFDVGGPLEGEVQNAAPHEIHGWVEERISWAPLP